MGASGVNWSNVPHESILGQINGGAGVGPVSDAAASFRRIAATLRAADQDLRDALAGAGASWEGQAAADMRTASTPLATWADEADQMATQTGRSTEVFGHQFADTRTAMPSAVSVPSGSWVDDTGLSGLPGVTTDRERAEEAADAAHQEAARIMESYDNTSYETVRTQYFSQPPAVVLEVPPPASAGGPAVGGVPSAGGGTAYGGSTAPTGYPGSTAPAGGWMAPQSPQPTGGGAVLGSPTAPAGAAVPATTVPGNVVPVGPSPAGGTAAPPPGGLGPGGVRPGTSGGRKPGSGTGGPNAGPLPAVPGMPGRGYGPGGYGPGEYGAGPGGRGFGPGGSPGIGSGAFGPGGPGGAFGPGGGPGGPGSQGGPGAGLGPAGADPDGRPVAGAGGRQGVAGAGYGPMGGAAQREEDVEHRRPDYLVETEDIWGDGTRVAPPVIGERPPQ